MATNPNKLKRLIKNVKALDDALSKATTALWHEVNPTSDEQELVRDVMLLRDDNANPTDLEVLRKVISLREENEGATSVRGYLIQSQRKGG